MKKINMLLSFLLCFCCFDLFSSAIISVPQIVLTFDWRQTIAAAAAFLSRRANLTNLTLSTNIILRLIEKGKYCVYAIIDIFQRRKGAFTLY
jgi:hypothetical protein